MITSPVIIQKCRSHSQTYRSDSHTVVHIIMEKAVVLKAILASIVRFGGKYK